MQHLWCRGYVLGCIDVGAPVCAWSLGLLHQHLCCWRVFLQQRSACQMDCPCAGFCGTLSCGMQRCKLPCTACHGECDDWEMQGLHMHTLAFRGIGRGRLTNGAGDGA